MTQNSPSASFTEIPEDVFDREYKPRTRDNGDLFAFEDVKDAPLNTVWTIVEGDEPEVDEDATDDDEPVSAGWYAIPGFHIVNVMGYVLTEKPWTDENVQAVYFEPTGG